jgi:hypothetical protein
MMNEPYILDAEGAHIHVRLARTMFQQVQRRFLWNPEWSQAHPVQKVCIVTLYEKVQVSSLVDAKDLPKDVKAVTDFPMTFAGIPLKTDPTMPDNVIEFYIGTQLVGKITNLAKPPGL